MAPENPSTVLAKAPMRATFALDNQRNAACENLGRRRKMSGDRN